MKLQTKIQLFTTVFMVSLILLVNASIYFLFYQISAKSELNELQDQTNSIVQNLQSNPDIVKNELLSVFLPTNGMIRVTKDDGEPAVRTITKKGDFTNLPREYSTKESREIIKNANGTNVAVIEKPIIWHDGSIVTLQVSQHLIALHTTMQTLMYVLIIATLFILIPIIFAGNVLSRVILKPIQTFIHTMQRNTNQDNWEKIDIKNHSQDEIYQMETTFNEMIDHLNDSFKKQEQFVSDASHELKTPISIIKGYSQLVKRHGTKRPELLPEAIEAIDSETDRMQLLIEQMLELAKNRNKVEFSRDNIDLIILIKHVQKNFIDTTGRNIILTSDYPSLFVCGNKKRLEQVMYILIDNALKYSDKTIELNVKLIQGYVQIAVVDFGPGISKKEQKHIFNRFYRVDEARSRTSGGTGLGLAIAKTIINEHNGFISVLSEPGKGTQFIFELPVVQ